MWQKAVDWALEQTVQMGDVVVSVSAETPAILVDKVREYLNNNGSEYGDFSFDDLVPFLPQ